MFERVSVCAVMVVVAVGCGESLPGGAESTREAELIGGQQATSGEWDSSLFWITNGGSCGGVRVGPRYILTAAHCVQVIDRNANRMYGQVRTDMQLGYALLVTGEKQLDDNTRYAQIAIQRTIMHPAWSSSCAGGCLYSNAVRAPYAPDLALIELKADLPSTIKTARIETGPIMPGTEVAVTGYGCENGLYGGFQTPGKNKFSITSTERYYAAGHSNSFVSSADAGTYERSYVITPGKDPAQEASLCLADSGSPLFLRDTSRGEVVLGVNAYYTFTDVPSGISTTNAHTRLGWDNPHATTVWLKQNLPSTSFSTNAPMGYLENLEYPAPADETIGSIEAEELVGGPNPELIRGEGGADTLSGGGSGDVLEGGEGSDILYGEDGDDFLLGGEGPDFLDGGRGFDVLEGGAGADIYILRPTSSHDIIRGDTQGANRIVCEGFDAPLRITGAGKDVVVMSADGSASMRVKNSRIVTFYGCR